MISSWLRTLPSKVFELSVKCGITTPSPTPLPSPLPTPVPTFEFVTRLTLNATMRVEFASPVDFSHANAHQVSERSKTA
jgi:hypothetical protein